MKFRDIRENVTELISTAGYRAGVYPIFVIIVEEYSAGVKPIFVPNLSDGVPFQTSLNSTSLHASAAACKRSLQIAFGWSNLCKICQSLAPRQPTSSSISK